MPLFSTAFTPPPPLTGLTIFANVEASAIELAWDATALGADFGGYRVYRSLDGGATWTLLALITSETTAYYDDYAAPLGRELTYRVTVSNLDYESDPVTASSKLDVSAWWIVRPGDLELTFRLTYVDDHRKSRPKAQTMYRPVGRARPLVVSALQQGWEGSVSATVPHALRAVVDRLVEVTALFDEFVYLKTPFGEVMPVALGDIEVSRGTGGSQTLSFPFTEVR